MTVWVIVSPYGGTCSPHTAAPAGWEPHQQPVQPVLLPDRNLLGALPGARPSFLLGLSLQHMGVTSAAIGVLGIL